LFSSKDLQNNMSIFEMTKILTSKIYFKFVEFHESKWGRKTLFMLTQCNHAFHSDCLESWLKYKLECPTCRSDIEY